MNLLTSAFVGDNADTILLSILKAQGQDTLPEDDPDYVIGVTSTIKPGHHGQFTLTIKTFPIPITELLRINAGTNVLIPVTELLDSLGGNPTHLLSGVSYEFADTYKLWTINPLQPAPEADIIEGLKQEVKNARARLTSAEAILEILTTVTG